MVTEVIKTENKKGCNTIRLIHHGDRIQCIHHEALNVWFSYQAWRFFSGNYEGLIQLKDKVWSNDSSFHSGVKVAIQSEYNSVEMQIWPGQYMSEWRIAFAEGEGEQRVVMNLTLYSPSGKGSVDYTDEIREMLNAIE
ncbi:MAG: hypothetical protein KBB78_03470 [Candidatus Pacebacteria bacterium]|nr:hypothetical protein [Candidatus Paceibacterota bacterium]